MTSDCSIDGFSLNRDIDVVESVQIRLETTILMYIVPAGGRSLPSDRYGQS
jgi:hypothetical protein